MWIVRILRVTPNQNWQATSSLLFQNRRTPLLHHDREDQIGKFIYPGLATASAFVVSSQIEKQERNTIGMIMIYSSETTIARLECGGFVVGRRSAMARWSP